MSGEAAAAAEVLRAPVFVGDAFALFPSAPAAARFVREATATVSPCDDRDFVAASAELPGLVVGLPRGVVIPCCATHSGTPPAVGSACGTCFRTRDPPVPFVQLPLCPVEEDGCSDADAHASSPTITVLHTPLAPPPSQPMSSGAFSGFASTATSPCPLQQGLPTSAIGDDASVAGQPRSVLRSESALDAVADGNGGDSLAHLSVGDDDVLEWEVAVLVAPPPRSSSPASRRKLQRLGPRRGWENIAVPDRRTVVEVAAGVTVKIRVRWAIRPQPPQPAPTVSALWSGWGPAVVVRRPDEPSWKAAAGSRELCVEGDDDDDRTSILSGGGGSMVRPPPALELKADDLDLLDQLAKRRRTGSASGDGALANSLARFVFDATFGKLTISLSVDEIEALSERGAADTTRTLKLRFSNNTAQELQLGPTFAAATVVAPLAHFACDIMLLSRTGAEAFVASWVSRATPFAVVDADPIARTVTVEAPGDVARRRADGKDVSHRLYQLLDGVVSRVADDVSDDDDGGDGEGGITRPPAAQRVGCLETTREPVAPALSKRAGGGDETTSQLADTPPLQASVKDSDGSVVLRHPGKGDGSKRASLTPPRATRRPPRRLTLQFAGCGLGHASVQLFSVKLTRVPHVTTTTGMSITSRGSGGGGAARVVELFPAVEPLLLHVALREASLLCVPAAAAVERGPNDPISTENCADDTCQVQRSGERAVRFARLEVRYQDGPLAVSESWCSNDDGGDDLLDPTTGPASSTASRVPTPPPPATSRTPTPPPPGNPASRTATRTPSALGGSSTDDAGVAAHVALPRPDEPLVALDPADGGTPETRKGGPTVIDDIPLRGGRGLRVTLRLSGGPRHHHQHHNHGGATHLRVRPVFAFGGATKSGRAGVAGEVAGAWSTIAIKSAHQRVLKVLRSTPGGESEVAFGRVVDVDGTVVLDEDAHEEVAAAAIASDAAAPRAASSAVGSTAHTVLGGPGWFQGIPPAPFATLEEAFARQFEHVRRTLRRLGPVPIADVPPQPDSTYVLCFAPGLATPLHWRMPPRRVDRVLVDVDGKVVGSAAPTAAPSRAALQRSQRRQSQVAPAGGGSPTAAAALSTRPGDPVIQVAVLYAIDANPFSVRWQASNAALVGHRLSLARPLEVSRLRADSILFRAGCADLAPRVLPPIDVPPLFEPGFDELDDAVAAAHIDRIRFQAVSAGPGGEVHLMEMVPPAPPQHRDHPRRRPNPLSSSSSSPHAGVVVATDGGDDAIPAPSWSLPLQSFAGSVRMQIHVRGVGWSAWTPELRTATLTPLWIGLRQLSHTALDVTWHRRLPDLDDDDEAIDAWERVANHGGGGIQCVVSLERTAEDIALATSRQGEGERVEGADDDNDLALFGATPRSRRNGGRTGSVNDGAGDMTAVRSCTVPLNGTAVGATDVGIVGGAAARPPAQRGKPPAATASPKRVRSAVFEGLAPGGQYRVSLREEDRLGWRSTSDDVVFSTLSPPTVSLVKAGAAYCVLKVQQPPPEGELIDCREPRTDSIDAKVARSLVPTALLPVTTTQLTPFHAILQGLPPVEARVWCQVRYRLPVPYYEPWVTSNDIVSAADADAAVGGSGGLRPGVVEALQTSVWSVPTDVLLGPVVQCRVAGIALSTCDLRLSVVAVERAPETKRRPKGSSGLRAEDDDGDSPQPPAVRDQSACAMQLAINGHVVGRSITAVHDAVLRVRALPLGVAYKMQWREVIGPLPGLPGVPEDVSFCDAWRPLTTALTSPPRCTYPVLYEAAAVAPNGSALQPFEAAADGERIVTLFWRVGKDGDTFKWPSLLPDRSVATAATDEEQEGEEGEPTSDSGSGGDDHGAAQRGNKRARHRAGGSFDHKTGEYHASDVLSGVTSELLRAIVAEGRGEDVERNDADADADGGGKGCSVTAADLMEDRATVRLPRRPQQPPRLEQRLDEDDDQWETPPPPRQTPTPASSRAPTRCSSRALSQRSESADGGGGVNIHHGRSPQVAASRAGTRRGTVHPPAPPNQRRASALVQQQRRASAVTKTTTSRRFSSAAQLGRPSPGDASPDRSRSSQPAAPAAVPLAPRPPEASAPSGYEAPPEYNARDLAVALRGAIAAFEPDGLGGAEGEVAAGGVNRIDHVVDCSTDLEDAPAAGADGNAKGATDGGRPGIAAARSSKKAKVTVDVATAVHLDARTMGLVVMASSGAGDVGGAAPGKETSSAGAGLQYVVEVAGSERLTAWRPAATTTRLGARFRIGGGDLARFTFRVATFMHGFRCNVSPAVAYDAPLAPDGASVVTSVTAVTHEAIKLRWTPPANVTLQNRLRYDVQIRLGDEELRGDWQTMRRTGVTTATVTGLLIDTAYEVRVVPFSGFGVGAPAPTALARTSRMVRPGSHYRQRPMPLPQLGAYLLAGGLLVDDADDAGMLVAHADLTVPFPEVDIAALAKASAKAGLPLVTVSDEGGGGARNAMDPQAHRGNGCGGNTAAACTTNRRNRPRLIHPITGRPMPRLPASWDAPRH